MRRGFKAKICGTTNVEDALLAAENGADFFGVVVEASFSPRTLTVDEAVPLFKSPPIPGVSLVFEMNHDRVRLLADKLKPFAVQFLGRAKPSYLGQLKKQRPTVQLWQSVHLPKAGEKVAINGFIDDVKGCIDAGVDALIFDTAAVSGGKMKFGGTGMTSDWGIVKELIEKINCEIPIWLAGGINPENVGEAIDIVTPYGIDLCSGVEAYPGKKDPQKVRALMKIIDQKSKIRRENH
jgi:phosphoribosylanthranilate isomerase